MSFTKREMGGKRYLPPRGRKEGESMTSWRRKRMKTGERAGGAFVDMPREKDDR